MFNCVLTGYTGAQCEKDINNCIGVNCYNGTCIDLIGNYKCQCRSGYKGTFCQEDIDECEVNPCRNGGTCDHLANGEGYECKCPIGTSGRCKMKKTILFMFYRFK